MSEEQKVVSDDWTRNWQAKIAVKITAAFLWIVIGVGFIGIVLFTDDMGERADSHIRQDVESIVYRSHRILANGDSPLSDETRNELSTTIQEILDQSDVGAVSLVIDDQYVGIGKGHNSWVKNENVFPRILLQGADNPIKLTVTAYHPPVEDLVRKRRGWVVAIVAMVVLTIGVILNLTIHNILAKPFKLLVDATRTVSRGKLDLRLDVDRTDEFGQLSRFFNQMLEKLQSQQRELKLANEGLTAEVAVRKRAEHELKSHRDALEQLVHERTEDLQAARDEAVKASSTKSAFIANISHEMRTPLTPIIGFAETLLEDKQSPSERRSALQTIIRNSKHLLTLINDVLDLSKIEADKLEIEKLSVNPFEMMQDVDSLVGMLARDKGLEYELRYEFPMPKCIFTDPFRAKQILINLATNAVKFTDKGFVRLLVAFDGPGSQLRIVVSDTGIGVGEDKQTRLFQAFSQADSSTTREYGGTGLGLYISQRLARMLGGDLEMESVLGVGSRFTLTLDAGVIDEQDLVYDSDNVTLSGALEAGAAAGIRLSGKVLVAEDNPDNQHLISHFVKRTGASVSLCENGKLAVEEALKSDYDLLLMDMQMPVMGGCEAVETLRSVGYQVPIIALTANAMKEDVEKYKTIGCDGFLSKPIEQEKFYGILRQYLSAENMHEEGDDEDPVFQELVRKFKARLPAILEDMTTAAADSNWQELQHIAHQLKGSGGSFNCPEITEYASHVEQILKQGTYSDLDEALEKLSAELVAVNESGDAKSVDMMGSN